VIDLEFEKKAKLFAITYASKDGKSLYDWIPFGKGDSLGEIVANHNKRCLETYKKMKWGDHYIKAMAEGTYLVPSHISKISDWLTDDFSENNYILIDSTMVEHESDITKLVKILPQRKWYYLLFVGKVIPSIAKEFDYGSVIPCGQLQNQAQFEKFLSNHCHNYGQLLSEALKARDIDPKNKGRLDPGYVAGIPSIASNVQGFSNFIDMDGEQERSLAFRVSQKGYKEFAPLIKNSSISKKQAKDLNMKFIHDSRSLSLNYGGRKRASVIQLENSGKYFVLLNDANKSIGTYKGRQPRQAALKAANRGFTDIKLRERGTKKVHIFIGEREQIDKPVSAPAWMPGRIWKPWVKKVGVQNLKELK
jgi:hypothetical protein